MKIKFTLGCLIAAWLPAILATPALAWISSNNTPRI
jgi:hypothetical protein